MYTNWLLPWLPPPPPSQLRYEHTDKEFLVKTNIYIAVYKERTKQRHTHTYWHWHIQETKFGSSILPCVHQLLFGTDFAVCSFVYIHNVIQIDPVRYNVLWNVRAKQKITISGFSASDRNEHALLSAGNKQAVSEALIGA